MKTKVFLTAPLLCVLLMSLPAADSLRAADNPPTYLFSVGSPTETRRFIPLDVGVDTNRNIYMLDQLNYRVLKFSPQGDFVTQWGSAGSENGQFVRPMALALDAANSVYVVDARNLRVTKFTSNGAFVRQFGTPDGGGGNGGLGYPTGVAIDANGNVYVADPGNLLIQKFTSAGAFSTQWPFLADIPGATPLLDADHYRIAVDTAANVYVSESSFDLGLHRVEKFSSTGVLRTRWGAEGSGPGQFQFPAALAIARSNHVYVADSSRLQRFSTNTVFETQWGSEGSAPGQFSQPGGVAVDRSGNLVYVADTGNARIQVFAYSNAGPPLILRQPAGQPLSVGANVTLSVEAFGELPLSYQWRRDGTNLLGATLPALTFPNVSLADAGNYSVRVTNRVGSVFSSNATLRHTAPFASMLPTAIPSPTSAVLRGFATPNSGPATAWFEWGADASFGNIAGATNLPEGAAVVFVSANLSGLSGAPDYHCRLAVSNSAGVVRSADHVFALGRRVYVWGSGFSQIGQYNAPPGGDLVAIAGGSYYALALRNDGGLLAWGANGFGEGGVPPGLRNVTAIAAGNLYNLALKDDGRVAAWGGTFTVPYVPTNVPVNLTNVVAISAGYDFGVALKADGTVVNWGSQEGYAPALSNVVAIASGADWSLALKNNGVVIAWGANYSQVSGAEGLSGVVAIAAGARHGVALKQDKTVVVWGASFNQQTNVPSGLSNVAAIAASSLGDFSLALKSDGTVVGWGASDEGQTHPPAGLTKVVTISAGRGDGFALSGAAVPLAFPGVTVSEGDTGTTDVLLTLTLDRSSEEPVSVDYATGDATAQAGSDYVAASGTLLFAPGQTNRTITVRIRADLVVESGQAEAFVVELSNPTNMMLPVNSTNLFATVTIVDDDLPPVITHPPQSQEVRMGFDAAFRVTATGKEPFFYQWRRNGTNLVGATNRLLIVTNVQPADDGARFTVLVSNRISSVVSAQALLTVRPPLTNSNPGAVDLSFNPGTGADEAVNTLAVQPDGRVLIGGAFTTFDEVPRRRVARLLAEGALDNSFIDPGVDAEVFAIALQPDGKVLIAGAFTNVGGLTRPGVARLLDTGAVDPDFNAGPGATNLWRALVLQPDGKVVVGGNVKSPLSPRVVRLNADGTPDTGFVIPRFDSSPAVETLALQSDGKILLGGSFLRVAGAERARVALLNADGTLDPAFLRPIDDLEPSRLGSSGLMERVRTLSLLPDGKVLIGGDTGFFGPRRGVVVRLFANGRADQSFVPGTDVYSQALAPNFSIPSINTLIQQADGKLLLGGTFGAVNGETNRHFARLYADGRRDVHFNTLGGADGAVLATAPLSDGRVLIAGRFTGVDGVPSSGIARLLGDDGPPQIAAPPANAAGTVGFPATFSVTTTNGRPPLRYQWFFDDATALPAATNATLSLASAQLADAGDYRVVVSNDFGAVTSSVATLAVVSGPRLVSAGSVDGRSIGLAFSVSITTNSATNLLNYSLSSGGPITNATLRPDRRSVLLQLQTPVPSIGEVTAANLVDAGSGGVGGGTAAVRAANMVGTNLAGTARAGSVFTSRSGEFEVAGFGSDFCCQGYLVSELLTGDFDVKARVNFLEWNYLGSKAGLLAMNGPNMVWHLTVMPPPPGRNIYEPAGLASHGIPGVTFDFGNVHADPPDSWLRMKRTGNLFEGFSSVNGVEWRPFARTTLSVTNTLSVGVVASAQSFRSNAVALFRDYDSQYKGPLADALDTTGLTWTTTGSQPWFVQTAVTHDGNLALQSGAVTHSQTSSVETTVAGPGTLSFWWKVSSEAGADRLTFRRNGTDQLEVSGEVDWEQRTVNIPAGSRTLTWTYAKNGSGTSGADAAWLDQVLYAPEPGSPVILTEPADLAVKASSNAVFSVVAANATGLPMSYQWFFNQTVPVGFSSPTLLITNVGSAELGGYSVVVSNAIGSVTSRVATLELAYPPVIVVAPQSRTNVAGDDVTFTVVATNNATLPIGFIWRKGSFPIASFVLSNRTGSITLFNVATNITTSGPGIYRVILTNVAATAIAPSSPNVTFTLTVLPATAPTASTLAATGLTPNGATLNASINPMGAQTVAWFDYGFTAAYDTRTSAINVGNASNLVAFSQAVTGLLPATNYHYRVVATNHGGMALGADMTFQTAPLARPTISAFTRLPNGQFRLQFIGPAGSTYAVLVSTNLSDWTPLGPALEATPGQFEFTDTDAPNHPTRFYNLKSP